MLLCCFFKLGANIYGLGLSNEPLFINIAQGAAKLWPVKVVGPKKIQSQSHSNLFLLSKREESKAIFWTFGQVTVLHPLDLLWWIVAHLKALSHICLHFNEKLHKSTLKVCNLGSNYPYLCSSYILGLKQNGLLL